MTRSLRNRQRKGKEWRGEEWREARGLSFARKGERCAVPVPTLPTSFVFSHSGKSGRVTGYFHTATHCFTLLIDFGKLVDDVPPMETQKFKL